MSSPFPISILNATFFFSRNDMVEMVDESVACHKLTMIIIIIIIIIGMKRFGEELE